MQKNLLKIVVPETCSEELRYVVRVIFDEFWGVPYDLRIAEQAHVSISLNGFDGRVTIDCDFFSAASRNWLASECLPELPLSSLNIRNYDFLKDLEFAELPIFFGNPNLIISKNLIETKFDIFGAIFFMLTRYEEYIQNERDEHDRVLERLSFGHKAGLQATPIVNHYLEVLWRILKSAGFSIERRNRLFKVEPTCDLDLPFDPAFYSLWFSIKNGTKYFIDNLSLLQFSNNLGKYFLGNRFSKDENVAGINWIMTTCEDLNIRAQFYIIPKITHRADCYNNLFSSQSINLVKEILSRGHFIGMHPGYLCYLSEDNFAQSVMAFRQLLELVNQPIDSIDSRMHYLRWKFPETLDLYSKFNIGSDSTMAYAETPGFRSGTCYEHTMYNLESRSPTGVIQKPLILMESSLLDEPHLGLGHSDKAKRIMLELQRQCKLYNGNFRFLWHNCHLASQEDRDFFKLLVEH
jgi:hypothetical protein